MKHVCVISETIGPYNAIGRIARYEVLGLLEMGHKVSVVAKLLDPELVSKVDWLKLYSPPRSFLLQWLSGRYFIKKALGNRERFDHIHGHQPQIADLCDTFRCHFITKVAAEKNCLYDGVGLRRVIDIIQKWIVLKIENRLYSRWNPKTRMLWSSQLTADNFRRLYGNPALEQVFTYPAPDAQPVSIEERLVARKTLWGGDVPDNAIVAGYLGGVHARKGYAELLNGIRDDQDICLLFAGPGSANFADHNLGSRIKCLGLVDTDRFYPACDVLLVPSHFDPVATVTMEAAARGVPSIATSGVGALKEALSFGAVLEWNFDEPLGKLIRTIAADSCYSAGALAWTKHNDRKQHAARFSELIQSHRR